MRHFSAIAALSASLWLGACSCLGGDTSAIAPETKADQQLTEWRLEGRAMVAAADARAVKAATDILERGGHAVDAAIAAHAVLGLVEPQSSGIGGGGFMLVYDQASGEITMYDGRETAPASIDENLFIKEDGAVMGFLEAWQSGRSVGAPGIVSLYETAHADFGKTDWSRLFAPAAALAREGFEVTARLHDALANPRLRAVINLDDEPAAAAYFYPDGAPLAVGDIRVNTAYAQLMDEIAAQGADALYKGPMAEAIVAGVQRGANPGALSLEDLASYATVKRKAGCGAYLDYTICSATPPSSGSVTQAMIMGLYERFTANQDLSADDKLIAFIDAQRLAYADRDHYVADSDFVTVPAEELTDPAYLDARAGDRFAPDAHATPGDPGAVLHNTPMIDMWGRDTTQAGAGTTHLSIVDIYGNAVSMTATVESAFGSSRWTPEGGFLLNNELTDFARAPRKNGKLTANAPAGGKRPRSSMSPTFVFDADKDLFMVTGSPGGNSIIAYTAKTLKAVLDDGASAQEAVDLPNIIARGDTVNVEIGVPGGQDAANLLKARGYDVKEREGENSGLHVIIARRDHFEGGADSRREGVAVAVEAAPALVQ